MAKPLIFVSHSHQDDSFTARLVDDLQAAGAQVWYDVTGIDYGDFVERINEALTSCEWLVLVLTRAALDSEYVRWEVNAALHRVRQKRMRGVVPVVAGPFLPESVPPLWDLEQRFDATHDYDAALAGVLRAVGLTPAVAGTAPPTDDALSPAPAAAGPAPGAAPVQPPSSASCDIPPGRFPLRLAQLGFLGQVINGVEVIVPPMCDVPGGPFFMGSDPALDKGAESNERPQHIVSLRPFLIGRYPITVAEYACFVRAGGHDAMDWKEQPSSLDHPAVWVSWRDAVAYASWLAELTGEPWRLPSEAEWEKAARWDPAAHHSPIYPWGDAFDRASCNISGRGTHTTTPVRAHLAGASPCGAYDMAGNVWEWTSSLLKPYPYDADDGREYAGSTERRELRGGSFGGTAHHARAANRNSDRPDIGNAYSGFRLARALPAS